VTALALDNSTATNPFSTRCIRPGAIPFAFAPGEDAAALVARLAALRWTAQIIGPHGAGKSTLLAAITPELAKAGRPAYLIALHDGQRKPPQDWHDGVRNHTARIVIVDGFEQLSSWQRWRLKRKCRAAGLGLLVTAHDDVGLPTLARLTPSLDTFHHVVSRLQAHRSDAVPAELVDARFAACEGNMREALLALYDDYERRRACRRAADSQVSDGAGCNDRTAGECSASSDGIPAPAAD
jgi:hypothetical protein